MLRQIIGKMSGSITPTAVLGVNTFTIAMGITKDLLLETGLELGASFGATLAVPAEHGETADDAVAGFDVVHQLALLHLILQLIYRLVRQFFDFMFKRDNSRF